jgi:CRISPR/Cas system-associated protein endoribonuclease Cas2
MKINVSYTSWKHYDRSSISQWMWMFKRYTLVRGFIMRVFGIYINVRESNAAEKMIRKVMIRNQANVVE